jgi:hypothetical protein
MSSNNYGEKNLHVVVPIEIVPEELGIKEEIAETKRRIKEGRSEEFRRQGIFDIYNRNDDKASPKGREAAVPAESNSPLNMLRRTTGKSGLIQGIPPTKPSYMKTSLQGTANVPQGGQAPIDKKTFYQKKVKSPGAGLHVYGEGEPGKFEQIIAKALGGPEKAQTALNMLKNPIQLAKFLGPAAAPIFAAFIAVDVTKRVINELVRKGSVYDRTFKNIIANRTEALRTREQQQAHLIGYGDTSQLITTTTAGTTSPRDSYNTYTVFNKDQAELEQKFSIRNNSGYD